MVDKLKTIMSAEDLFMATAGVYGLYRLGHHVVVQTGAIVELERLSFDVGGTWRSRGFREGSTRVACTTAIDTVVTPRPVDLSTPRGLGVLRSLADTQRERTSLAHVIPEARGRPVRVAVGRVTTKLHYQASSFSYEAVILDDPAQLDEIRYPVKSEAVGRRLPLTRHLTRARTAPQLLDVLRGRTDPVPLSAYHVPGSRMDPWLGEPPRQRLGTVAIGFTPTETNQITWSRRFWGTLTVPRSWLVRIQAGSALLGLCFAVADFGTRIFSSDHKGLLEIGGHQLELSAEMVALIGAAVMTLSIAGSLQYAALTPFRILAS